MTFWLITLTENDNQEKNIHLQQFLIGCLLVFFLSLIHKEKVSNDMHEEYNVKESQYKVESSFNFNLHIYGGFSLTLAHSILFFFGEFLNLK